jgi:hypothetical protein
MPIRLASCKLPLLTKSLVEMLMVIFRLIALMMVKLNMTVQECIKQYKGLSKQIFGKPHWLGKRTMGFGTTKYSGARLRKFVVNVMKQSKNALGPNHTMEDDTHHKEIHWYVHRRRSWGVASPTCVFAPAF